MTLGGGLRPPSEPRRVPDGARLGASPQDSIARAKPALERREAIRELFGEELSRDGDLRPYRSRLRPRGRRSSVRETHAKAPGAMTVGETSAPSGERSGRELSTPDGPARRSRTVFEARARGTGRMRVVDYRSERRLIVDGDILSIYPLDGDWGRLRTEYWWHALAAVGVPPRPRALLVGLGGGTQVHLLQRLAQPKEITVIERDPMIVRVACEWFGLRDLGGLEFLCGDATHIVPWLTQVGRRFDFVMEDAVYAAPPEVSLPLAEALVPLVAPGGRLVINRHRRGDGRVVAAALRPRFRRIVVRRVRREGENVLICCVK
jgi:protein-L-isoaspartate O-methyltransferase